MTQPRWKAQVVTAGLLLLAAAGCGEAPAATERPAPIASATDYASESATTPADGQDAPSTPYVSVLPVGPDTSAATGDPEAAPYAWINGPYVARVGSELTLDGSGSYARAGVLVTYAWDLDGDGVAERTVPTPQLRHTFTHPYSGDITLTVTDSSGRTATARTHVGVTDDGDETPPEEDNCPDVANHGQEDYDGDGLGDECDPTPGWPTSDAPGVTEGVS